MTSVVMIEVDATKVARWSTWQTHLSLDGP
jgi:hypothetical protein